MVLLQCTLRQEPIVLKSLSKQKQASKLHAAPPPFVVLNYCSQIERANDFLDVFLGIYKLRNNYCLSRNIARWLLRFTDLSPVMSAKHNETPAHVAAAQGNVDCLKVSMYNLATNNYNSFAMPNY